MNPTRILYTYTDEAPALATYSLLPIIQAFTRAAGVVVETRDISLAGRILASFPDELPPDKRRPDDLAELGEIAKTPEANIIKLPNISASIPQLQAAIRELQQHGYAVPDYPEEPRDDRQKAIKAKYAKVLGSAVNPVLREGNSDRRVAAAVKAYARSHPHSMGAWSRDSKTHVVHMTAGDFYGSEQSAVIADAGSLRIELTGADGATTVLKEGIKVDANDVVGASVMSRRALQTFFAESIDEARAEGILLSLHLKATMMKVSDPIMFGHAVREYYKDVFEKHAATFQSLGVDPDNGIGDAYSKMQSLPADQRAAIEADINTVYGTRPALAMVDSSERHHQPARAERRDHRRLDACRHPRIRPDVGTGRQASRYEGDDSGPLVRGHLSSGHRRLQDARRVRREDDGHGVERRPHGAKRGGVRLARQDVRDPARRRGARDHSGRQAGLRAPCRSRRHLAHVPDERPADPGLGEADGEPGPADRARGDLLAGSSSVRTTATSSQRRSST